MVVHCSTGGRWAGNFDLMFIACETCKKVDSKAAKNDTYNYVKWRRWCAKAVLKLWPPPRPPHRPSAFVKILWLAGFQSKCNASFLEEELLSAQTYAIVEKTLRVSVIVSLNMVNLSMLGYSILTHSYAWVCVRIKWQRAEGPNIHSGNGGVEKFFYFIIISIRAEGPNIHSGNGGVGKFFFNFIIISIIITYTNKSVIRTTPLITYISMW